MTPAELIRRARAVLDDVDRPWARLDSDEDQYLREALDAFESREALRTMAIATLYALSSEILLRGAELTGVDAVLRDQVAGAYRASAELLERGPR